MCPTAAVGALIKTTLVDFPGRVAAAFFLRGCNMRCPYCYNIGLVSDFSDSDGLVPLDVLFAHLEKRRHVLSGLVISGGEPLLNAATPCIIERARALGLAVKLDTNGTFPDELAALIENPQLCPDFIAMDIKTAPLRYAQTMYGTLSSPPTEKITARLERSARIIASLAPTAREWRTVLVPPLVQESDIAAMAQLLPHDASWQFAQFRNENCIDPQ